MENRIPDSKDLFSDFISAIKKQCGLLDADDLKQVVSELNAVRRYVDKLTAKKNAELEKAQKQAEHISRITSMELPLDYNNAYSADERAAGIYAQSVDEGLILSQNLLGKVDIEYIAQICGTDCKTVIQSLKGSIYQNPETWEECFYKGWETADEYLSGNLMRKFAAAQEASQKFNGYFDNNIRAIKNILPVPLQYTDIYVTLGSPWVPAEIITDFMCHIAGRNVREQRIWDPESRIELKERVLHDEITGYWEVDKIPIYTKKYQTDRVEFCRLLEKMLNLKPIQVYDTISTKKGKKSIFNEADTIEANECAKRIREEFENWIWQDSSRRYKLEKIYEDKFGCVRKRSYDGSFLTFPGMSDDIMLYPYQKNAVARILFSPNTLLSHDVGAGKTYIMIAAGMKMKQTAISKKNLYVVPNNLTGQWQETFLKMYPSAQILCVTPGTFEKKKRLKVLESIRDEEYDGIIMAYSCFDLLEISTELTEKMLHKQIEEINQYLDRQLQNQIDMKSARRVRDQLERKLNQLTEEVLGISDTLPFDELGITGLFIDEAHNYKNIPIKTNTDLNGINTKGSAKCKSMLDKIRTVQQQNNGGGVIMATATPITNSVSDCFAMQTYLQHGELKMLGLHSFDSWLGMFAESKEEFEIDVDTSKYRMHSRLNRFLNLPELISLFSMISDYHEGDPMNSLPLFRGYQNCVCAKSPALQQYLDRISVRADEVRSHLVSRSQDNMLLITTDGRKAALDIRLVEPIQQFSYDMKVYRCAENIFDVWARDLSRKSTQIVFCDIATPKQSFNIYDELKRLLIQMGIPDEQIAFIHDADTERKRTAVFKKMNEGRIRVLIGSTFKLGLGVNVQTYLKAVHHLDVPWRPADMIQREGRILRQGNTNKEIQIFRYITEGSFDAYSWQLLEMKQRFITQLISGEYAERSGAEVDNTALSYGEVKALAVGDPFIRKRVETANELSKLKILQNKLTEHYDTLRIRITAIPAEKAQAADNLEKCSTDIAFLEKQTVMPTKEERRTVRELIASHIKANARAEKDVPVCSYRGFSVYVPANMLPEHPMVVLEYEGRYFTELGESAQGYLKRIDNCFAALTERAENLRDKLSDLDIELEQITNELENQESYLPQITRLTAELEQIDRKIRSTLK